MSATFEAKCQCRLNSWTILLPNANTPGQESSIEQWDLCKAIKRKVWNFWSPCHGIVWRMLYSCQICHCQIVFMEQIEWCHLRCYMYQMPVKEPTWLGSSPHKIIQWHLLTEWKRFPLRITAQWHSGQHMLSILWVEGRHHFTNVYSCTHDRGWIHIAAWIEINSHALAMVESIP
jgi:hypothetical protein